MKRAAWDMPVSRATRDRVVMAALLDARDLDDTADTKQRRPIVVGLDETPASHAALKWAIERSMRTGNPVSAVYVYDTPPAQSFRGHAVRSAREGHARARATGWIERAIDGTHAPNARLVVAEGSPVKVLLAASHTADLMVLGAPRQGRLRRVLTNRVASRCSGRAQCPVVLVPPEDEPGEQAGRAREGRSDEVVE
jgi:nucleotide-binding universal stress UspA family protein